MEKIIEVGSKGGSDTYRAGYRGKAVPNVSAN